MNAELRIYGGIGLPNEWGDVFRHEDLVSFLDQNQQAETITLRINSPGGLVRTGNAIMESLKNSGKTIHTIGEELVGSMATQIFLLGETRSLYPTTEFFLHNVQGGVMGSPDEIEKYLTEIRQYNEGAISFYLDKTGLDRDDLQTLLDNEVTITGAEALKLGFATSVITPVSAYIKRPNKMNLKDAIKKAFEKKEAAQDMALSMDDGRTLQISTGEEKIKIGDRVRIDGGAADDNEYQLSDGRRVIIQSGAIEDILNPVLEAPEVVEEAPEMEMETTDEEETDQATDLSAEVDSLKADIAELKEALATQSAEQGKAFNEVLATLRNVTSGGVNPSIKGSFTGDQEDKRTLSEKVASLRERRNKAISNGIQ